MQPSFILTYICGARLEVRRYIQQCLVNINASLQKGVSNRYAIQKRRTMPPNYRINPVLYDAKFSVFLT